MMQIIICRRISCLAKRSTNWRWFSPCRTFSWSRHLRIAFAKDPSKNRTKIMWFKLFRIWHIFHNWKNKSITWKTSSTFSIVTPMNFADTSNVPGSSVVLISNSTFLNLNRQNVKNHHQSTKIKWIQGFDALIRLKSVDFENDSLVVKLSGRVFDRSDQFFLFSFKRILGTSEKKWIEFYDLHILR